LDITNQTKINLIDAYMAPGSLAQYLRILTGAVLDVGNDEVDNIFGPNAGSLNIYYDPDLPENSALLAGDGVWDFAGGNGQLKPYHTPVPPSVFLLGSGLLGLGALGWRRRQRS